MYGNTYSGIITSFHNYNPPFMNADATIASQMAIFIHHLPEPRVALQIQVLGHLLHNKLTNIFPPGKL